MSIVCVVERIERSGELTRRLVCQLGLGADMEEPEKPKRKPRRKPDDVTKFERLFADIRRAAFDKTLPEETSEDTAPRKPPKKRC